MEPVREQPKPGLFKILATIARADGMVRVALTGYLGLCLWLTFNPEQSHVQSFLHLGLLVLVLVSLLQRLGAVPRPEERSFWWRISLAYGCWLAGAALRFFPDPMGPIPHRPLKIICYALIYVFMIRAVEMRPHRPIAKPRSLSERLMTWPTVTFFVLGLTIYFIFIPLTTSSPSAAGFLETPPSLLGDFLFYALLDLYLSVRLLMLARAATTQRWRVIYTGLALPWLGLFVSADLQTIASNTAFIWPTLSDPWLQFPFVLQVLAARVRQYPFGAEWDPAKTDSTLLLGIEKLSFILSAKTLGLGVLFPIIHILALRFDLISDSGHGARQGLVLIWLIFFGAIALIQHRGLERAAQNMWFDRMSFEEALRASEKDLRLILEKDRGSRMLQETEHRFDFAFKACPYTLMITRLRDGLCLEVNPAFEEMFGHGRDQAIGLSIDQLHLWADPDVATVRQLIETQGQISELEVLFYLPDKSEGHALLSAASMQIGDEKCLLTIVHDVTKRREAEKRLREKTRPLDETATAVLEIDGSGRIRTWNDGAENLLGWTAGEAVGQLAADLLNLKEEVDSVPREDRLHLRTKRGKPRLILAWRASLGEDGAGLLVAKPAEGAALSEAL